MIETVDNFIANDIVFDNKKVVDIAKNYYLKYSAEKDISKNLQITLSDYKKTKNELFGFIKESSDDELILSLFAYQDINGAKKYNIKTGNFIGKFTYNSVEINIKSRFSDIFLTRMLNFANDVFLDDVSVFDAQSKKSKSVDYSKFIIYYMFIQKLEKAFLLGLPKAYASVNHHEMKVKGKIDINRFIKYDIPFKGKISSTSREQKEIQEIIDVLYQAVSIIEKNKFNTKNISHIKTHLKQHRSSRYVSNETISKAIKSKALRNPIFAPYKKVLEYAKLIIDANNLEEKKDANKETFGFLVNVAELFEIYLVKLLQFRMPEWEVMHDRENELTVYDKQFYNRHMYPDIVMKKDNKIMVFDAKYKRMKFRGTAEGVWDLDRNDFFQINTYMTYYDKQKSLNVIAGGLLYPIEKEFDCSFNDENCEEDYKKLKAHSDNWFGNDKTQFIVDGIDLSSIEYEVEKVIAEDAKAKKRMENILIAEEAFIKRIREISGEY